MNNLFGQIYLLYLLKLKRMNYKEKMTDPTYKIVYIKKNGDIRVMKCRVESDYCEHISGKKEYIVVYDLINEGYRTVNTDTIKLFELM